MPSTEPLVTLVPQHPDHAAGRLAVVRAPGVHDWLDGDPPPDTEAMRQIIVRQNADPDEPGEIWLNWTVFADDRIVGFTQATVAPDGTASLGFVLTSDVWGKGIAHTACVRTIALLRARPDVARIVADTDRRNVRSQRLLARLGFVPDRETPTDLFYILPVAPAAPRR